MTLALHMNQQGENAWPSQALLAQRTALSDRAVRQHLKKAEAAGWLRIYERRRPGQAWFVNEYVATIPDGLEELCTSKPWEEDPTWKRPERGAARQVTTVDNPEELEQRPERGAERAESGARHPESDDTTPGTTFRDARHDVPTNSSSNSSLNYPKNTSGEGALASTTRAEDVFLDNKNGKDKDHGGRRQITDADLWKKMIKFEEVGDKSVESVIKQLGGSYADITSERIWKVLTANGRNQVKKTELHS